MASKYHWKNFKDTPDLASNDSSDVYSNFTLNKNHKCTPTFDHGNSNNANIAKTKSSNYEFDDAKKESGNFSSSNKSSSTLSLHIAAYENFFGVQNPNLLANDKLQKKNGATTTVSKIHEQKSVISAFNEELEFPRQQEDKPPTTEIQQFTASQKLLTPVQQPEHYLPHEKTFTVAAGVRGLAKRMIGRLLRYQQLDGFSNAQIITILEAAWSCLRPAPAFIHMEAPVTIFGDTHGQFADLIRIIEAVGMPPKVKYLFLGDYCDRGRKSIEILMLLFCFKVLYPTSVQILRGNHECSKMNRLYGFYEECKRTRGTWLWTKFQTVFNELPLCCLVSGRIICMHGGISPDIKGMETLYKLKKPRTHAECDTGVALDLMWSDPAGGADSCCNWQFNKMRNASWMFGTESVKEFCRLLDIDMIVRAHEVCRNGHMFYCDKLLCTVFSAPNYCGSDGNSASVMKVSANLNYSFVTFKPILDKSSLSKEKLAELEKQSKNADVKSPNPTTHITKLPGHSNQINEKSKQSSPTSVTQQQTSSSSGGGINGATLSTSNDSIVSSGLHGSTASLPSSSSAGTPP